MRLTIYDPANVCTCADDFVARKHSDSVILLRCFLWNLDKKRMHVWNVSYDDAYGNCAAQSGLSWDSSCSFLLTWYDMMIRAPHTCNNQLIEQPRTTRNVKKQPTMSFFGVSEPTDFLTSFAQPHIAYMQVSPGCVFCVWCGGMLRYTRLQVTKSSC